MDASEISKINAPQYQKPEVTGSRPLGTPSYSPDANPVDTVTISSGEDTVVKSGGNIDLKQFANVPDTKPSDHIFFTA